MLTRPTSNIKKTKSSDRPAFVLIEYRILLQLNCIITRQRLIPHNKTLHDFSTITIFFFFFFFFAKTCGVKKNKKKSAKSKKAVPSCVEEMTRRSPLSLFLLAVWSRFKALTAGSCVLMLLQLESAWEPPPHDPHPLFLFLLFLFSLLPILFIPPPPPPPPPAAASLSLPFLSSTHARLSTTERLKIAPGIPASIQRGEGGGGGRRGTSAHTRS